MRLLSLQLGTSAHWFSADDCVKNCYDDPSQRRALIDAFHDQMTPEERAVIVADEGGECIKTWLRANVLPDRGLLGRLEAILHPFVLQALADIRQKREGNLLVAEVPLHYEIGQVISADLVIVVAASRSVQVRRMMENRGLDEATTLAFLNAQWPIKAKVEKADVVIWNDGDPSALECQTLLLANLLNLE